MQLDNVIIRHFETDTFRGIVKQWMMTIAHYNGMEFVEYLTIRNGRTHIERVHSNINLNYKDQLMEAFGDEWSKKLNELFDEMEMRSVALWKDIYIEAYMKRISELIPKIDKCKDVEEFLKRWNTLHIDCVNADNFREIERYAYKNAEKHAAEIADLLVREIEDRDDTDILVLYDGKTYNLLTLDECIAKYPGFKEEYVDEAFYYAQNLLEEEYFTDLVYCIQGGVGDYFLRSYKMTLMNGFSMLAIRELMSDEICQMLDYKLLPCSDLLFLTHYLKEHYKKFGIPFDWS